MKRAVINAVLCILLVLSSGIFVGCQGTEPLAKVVPHITEWGIYKLDIATQEVSLVYSFPADSVPSGLRLNSNGDKFVFAQKMNDAGDENTEIFSIGIDGQNPTRLTNNNYWDIYPAWSTDGARIAFLSWRDKDLDVYMMNADGNNEVELFDSGFHDADIDWVGKNIVFTSQSAIWLLNIDSGQPIQVTDYLDKGKWGKANLPAGDYDPRLSPDGRKILFNRLENIDIPNGGYNIFTANIDGTSVTRLTTTGYSQGFANWSHSGEKLIYVVAAIDGEGKYDIYIINSDGTDNHNITPNYFPAGFLCHYPNFSVDDSAIYFMGQWWADN